LSELVPPQEPLDRACVALGEPPYVRDIYDGSANR